VTDEIQARLPNDHLIFPAPRRTGKTSILHWLKDNPDTDADFFLLNLEGESTANGWIASMMRALLEEKAFHNLLSKVGAPLGKIVDQLKRVEKIEVGGIGGISLKDAVGPDWKDSAAKFLRAVQGHGRPVVVFLLDEFP
jgi:hypothetical protein